MAQREQHERVKKMDRWAGKLLGHKAVVMAILVVIAMASGLAMANLGGGAGGGARSRRERRRGRDMAISLSVTLEEAALGCKKTISYDRFAPCEDCNGTGRAEGAQEKQFRDKKSPGVPAGKGIGLKILSKRTERRIQRVYVIVKNRLVQKENLK